MSICRHRKFENPRKKLLARNSDATRLAVTVDAQQGSALVCQASVALELPETKSLTSFT